MPARQSQKESTAKVNPKPISGRIEQQKTLFSWKAAARPFKKRDREFWVTIITIAAISGMVLFFVEGVMPVLLLIAITFLFYVLTTVEPESIDYSITNRGVKIAEKQNPWEIITRYWFGKRFNSELLIFETIRIPGRLELVINKQDTDKLRNVLRDYVLEEEVAPSYIDKAANWFSNKLPGN
jgi:hypothetical protein